MPIVETRDAPTVSVPCACGERIVFPLQALLQFKGGTCWNCGARLTLDPGANSDAIDALRGAIAKIQGATAKHVR